MYEEPAKTSIIGLRSYYYPLVSKLEEIGGQVRKNYSYEELKNYVLIIDEINRANISRVFGELITLLEPDKRIGQLMELESVLPSGESFSVPPNLYVVGTMNTADKSIAFIDIALRRRFKFIPVYPKYDLSDLVGGEILKKLNEKIIELKGIDFQIGHSYFLRNGDSFNLIEVMNSKVIPLLNEYFMNDTNTVKKILSYAGLNVNETDGLLVYSEDIQKDDNE